MTREEFKEAFKNETIVVDNNTSINPATLVMKLLGKYGLESHERSILVTDLKRIMSKQHEFLERVVNIRLIGGVDGHEDLYKKVLDELHAYNQNELNFLRSKWNYQD